MLLEVLTICSIAFGVPDYDCNNTWNIYVYDDELISYNGTTYKSIITYIPGNYSSIEIHLGSQYKDEDWYGIPILWYYLITGACQCNLNDELEEALTVQKLQKI